MTNISIEKLLEIGIALSSEKDGERLLETILTAAMEITNCDGGTIYTMSETEHALVFRVMITKSLNIFSGGRRGKIDLPPVPLTRRNVSACAAADRKLINVADVYDCYEYDFSGTKRYDETTGYSSKSMLSVPMENDYGDIIGVLQLLNAIDDSGNVIPFDKESEQVLKSLSSQAAICLTNMNYSAEVKELLDSFVRVMSTAIDARSPYNANHTKNMAMNAEGFLDWLEQTGNPWQFDSMAKQQFLMSVWLHDVGKLVIPLEIMDKESRLGAAYSGLMGRLDTIALKSRIAFLENKLDKDRYEALSDELSDTKRFVDEINNTGFLTDASLERVRQLGEKEYDDDGSIIRWFSPGEVEALMVRKGTLTDKERMTIESHILMTRKMLGEMSFTRNYRRVPEISGSHHEYVNGSGYPNKIKDDDVTAEMRLLTILDIFDALTARDRPYKPAVPVEKAFGILDSMANDGQIDREILSLFKLYLNKL